MNETQYSNNTPLVSVVLALFHPRVDWLVEQLESLNHQTYGNIEILMCDDGPDAPVDVSLIEKHLSNFPWCLITNPINMGSNKAFEKLTEMARGYYIAYCDQDDIWESDKIEMLVKRLETTKAELCYSDVSIIDEKGNYLASSITKIRKRHVFFSGNNLASELIIKNFVTGCAMMIRADTAKAAIPFERYMVHDHWLALFSSLRGEIVFEPHPTVRYRQHKNNQTAILAGVHTKEDYFLLRIILLQNRVDSLLERFQSNNDLQERLHSISKWIIARRDYFIKPSIKKAIVLWKNRSYGSAPTYFELVLPFIPKSLFGHIINLLR